MVQARGVDMCKASKLNSSIAHAEGNSQNACLSASGRRAECGATRDWPSWSIWDKLKNLEKRCGPLRCECSSPGRNRQTCGLWWESQWGEPVVWCL